MWYLLMALLGAAVGWYYVTYIKKGTKETGLVMGIALGVVGGLIGGAIGSLLSFAAVILFRLVTAIAGAYLLVFAVQRFTAGKGA